MHATTWQPPHNDLIRERTADRVNRTIDQQTEGALAETADSPERIRARLDALDVEWTIDRALMVTFAIGGSISAALAMRRLARTGTAGGIGVLFVAQMAFLFHHAIRRWSPPMPVFRRLGFRSAREICAERCALEMRLAELELEQRADALF